MYKVADAVLDTDTNELAAPDGTRVRLTPTESRILEFLMAHQGQALSAERIRERLWGHNYESDVNVIKTHVRHLREKSPGYPAPPSRSARCRAPAMWCSHPAPVTAVSAATTCPVCGTCPE